MEEDDHSATISPPQPQEQATNNVGDLMTKAKKAAASLWLILHAQNCRQPKGTCSHRGCDDTKLLLVHVKSCPAGPNFPCPCSFKGCNETRKLLAHYRRCKDLRLKQVGLGRRNNGMQLDQSCLVCSLMARYAKTMVDRHRSQGVGRSSNAASLLTDALSSSFGSTSAKFNVEKDFASFSTQEVDDTTRTTQVQKPCLGRSPSAQLMPPPPPRPSTADLNVCNSNESIGSPPTQSLLMHSRAVKIAAITDPESEESLSDPVMLGKSVDSSVPMAPFSILKKSSKEGPLVEDLVVPAPRRVRAESYDERKVVKFATTVSSRHYYPAPQQEHFIVPNPLADNNTGRPRSASCDTVNQKVLTSPSSMHSINEGEEYEEVFPMD